MLSENTHSETSLSANTLTSVRFQEALDTLNEAMHQEQELVKTVEKAIHSMGVAAQQACELSGGIISYETSDEVLCLKACHSVLTLVPAKGFARDSRLPHPRCMLCAQILIFSHHAGEEESALRTSFRIYPDGQCSDGKTSWNLSDGESAFFPYIADLLANHLLLNELAWSDISEVPEHLKLLPVVEGKADVKGLSHPCIGFECVITPTLHSDAGQDIPSKDAEKLVAHS